MSMPNQTWLPPELVTRLRQHQRELHDILAEFDKFEKCGGDCQDYRAEHKRQSDQIAALLENYAR